MLDARAIETFDPTLIDAVMAESGRRRQHHVRRRDCSRARACAACRPTTRSSAATPPSMGRLPSRIEVERGATRRAPRLGHRRQAVQGPQPDRPGHPGQRHRTSRVLGVSEKKGSVFGNSQDEFVLIPLGAFQRLFGSRRSLEITVKPVQPGRSGPGDGRRARGAAREAPPAPARRRQLRHVHVGHADGLLEERSRRASSRS